MTQESPSSGELVHYGVKGMKWGVRRSESNKANSGYSKEVRSQDQRLYGSRAVKKINRRMNTKGETHSKAKSAVLRNRAMKRLVLAGVLYAGPQIAALGEQTVGSIAQRAQTKRGQAAASAAMGLPRQASTGPSYSKKNRSGVYNITSV